MTDEKFSEMMTAILVAIFMMGFILLPRFFFTATEEDVAQAKREQVNHVPKEHHWKRD